MAHYSVLKISDTYISDQYDKIKTATSMMNIWAGSGGGGDSYKVIKITDKAIRVRYAD